ncbi:hypothetical protein KY306_03215 [Candidatus Woesearchaeota archaeon]|nr:hypothetical protein [Candidatus Woesearchaeota archaeon]
MKRLFVLGIVLLMIIPITFGQIDAGAGGTLPGAPTPGIEICETTMGCATFVPEEAFDFGIQTISSDSLATSDFNTFKVSETTGKADVLAEQFVFMSGDTGTYDFVKMVPTNVPAGSTDFQLTLFLTATGMQVSPGQQRMFVVYQPQTNTWGQGIVDYPLPPTAVPAPAPSGGKTSYGGIDRIYHGTTPKQDPVSLEGSLILSNGNIVIVKGDILQVPNEGPVVPWSTYLGILVTNEIGSIVPFGGVNWLAGLPGQEATLDIPYGTLNGVKGVWVPMKDIPDVVEFRETCDVKEKTLYAFESRAHQGSGSHTEESLCSLAKKMTIPSFDQQCKDYCAPYKKHGKDCAPLIMNEKKLFNAKRVPLPETSPTPSNDPTYIYSCTVTATCLCDP